MYLGSSLPNQRTLVLVASYVALSYGRRGTPSSPTQLEVALNGAPFAASANEGTQRARKEELKPRSIISSAVGKRARSSVVLLMNVGLAGSGVPFDDSLLKHA